MTELKVVKICAQDRSSGENVIERLEEILEFARNGHVKNVFISAVLNDGCAARSWANGMDPFTMIGQIETGKTEFIAQNIEGLR